MTSLALTSQLAPPPTPLVQRGRCLEADGAGRAGGRGYPQVDRHTSKLKVITRFTNLDVTLGPAPLVQRGRGLEAGRAGRAGGRGHPQVDGHDSWPGPYPVRAAKAWSRGE